MKNRFVKAIVSVLIVANAPLAYAADSRSAAASATKLEAIRKKLDLPALAMVVVRNGEICARAAVGIRKFGDPALVTTNDLFHIGSNTKSMTATLAGILIDEGKLNWSTTIADVFPDWKGKMDKEYEAVTMEQLLQHRGGVPGKPPGAAWARAAKQEGDRVEQRREFIKAVLSQPPEATPGTKTIYSNQGYAIAGAMMEKLAGMPWEELIQEQLFKPLHMDSAGFGPPGPVGKIEQPWGHIRQSGKIVPLQVDNPPAIAPAGLVHCTLDDLARYVIIHLQSNPTNGLLKTETLHRLHTPPKGGDYACGWVVLKRSWAGGNALMHNGSNTLWYVVMWLAPEKQFAVIAATNIGGPEATKGCDEVASAMIEQWLEK